VTGTGATTALGTARVGIGEDVDGNAEALALARFEAAMAAVGEAVEAVGGRGEGERSARWRCVEGDNMAEEVPKIKEGARSASVAERSRSRVGSKSKWRDASAA